MSMPAHFSAKDLKDIPELQALIAATKEIFTHHFTSNATHAACAPGRVNLIGEHTDYNDGFVLPMVSV